MANSGDVYPAHVARLRSMLEHDTAFKMAVGGSFYVTGRLEYLLLKQLGLQPHSSIVDVGCGSGRLAIHLVEYPQLSYLGTDVVAELLEYARKLAQRPDWRFLVTDGHAIPAAADSADFVVFFSVLTHTKHEESYRYLEEAKRVLKPGGKIVFSFLEFARPFHWFVFESNLKHARPGDPLTQFMDRDGIREFAKYLGLKIEAFYDGGVPHIPIDEELVWDDGRVQTGMADLGQSVAVLTKA